MPTSQFGGWLKHARETRGLSVEAVAKLTKIPSRHVEALERGDAVPLPAFYQRAEVRAVARAVGVDEQLAIERLEAEMPALAAPRRAPAPPERPEPAEPRSIRLDHVLAIAGTGLVVAWLTGWGPFDRPAASRDTVELPAPAPIAAPQAAVAPPLPSEVPSPPPAPAPAPPVETLAALVEAPIGPLLPIALADPVAPAAATELVIRTAPDGARVTVNGIGWGESPITIRNLEPGEQHIRVTMDGYTATERSVVIDEGHQQFVEIGLSPQ